MVAHRAKKISRTNDMRTRSLIHFLVLGKITKIYKYSAL
jgi:hypothetical protein